MVLTLITFSAFAGWVYLALFRSGFWRAGERLTDTASPASWPDVAAIIPARNEAASVGAVIAAHMKADYAGNLSIILVDDGSTDDTVASAARAAESGERPFEIVTAPDKPDGWSGKLWAVHNGIARAEEIAPKAKYYLLTDADIVLASDTLSRLVAKSQKERLTLASLMARLDIRGSWGSLLIPSFIYFFQKLYPFPEVNDPDRNTAAAAGGCMLVRRDALAEIGGVEAIKSNLIDDCALARKLKDRSPSTKIWLGLADDEALSLRENQSLGAIWNMVARTAFAQLNHSSLLLAGTVIGMFVLYIAPPLFALSYAWHGCDWALIYGLAAWGIMAFTYWPTLKHYDQEPWQSSLLPISAALYTAMTVSSAMRYWRGKGGQWKGRTY